MSENQVQHRESAGGKGEFYVERDGKRVAELTYTVVNGEAVASHTWVDPEHRGGTLAPDMVEALAAWARRGKRLVVPTCPYIKKVFGREEKYADVWKK